MNDLKETKQIQKETHETVIQISHNLKYIKTYDYDLFSFYTANRVPTHWKKILQSIELQDLTDRQPILVYECKNTGQFFISDGQNRFLACKNSKRPIYAIVVTGSTLKQGESSLSILNSYQKNWTKGDYLEYFCSKGFQEYKNMKHAKEMTGFSINTLQKFWTTTDGPQLVQRYQNGQLKFPHQAIVTSMVIKSCFDAVMKYKLKLVEITAPTALASSLFSFLRSGSTSKEFISQVAKYGHLIENCGNNSQYFRQWSHIWNFRKRERNRRIFILSKASNGRSIIK